MIAGGWGGPPYGPPPQHWCDHPGVSSEPLLPRTPHWCDRPGRSSDPVTPIGGVPYRQLNDSSFNLSCPVHSPFRFRFANGGPDFQHNHHHHSQVENDTETSEYEDHYTIGN
ncbi:hypothetical protein WA026_004101 [Henosepilachna vigintioctopunctata]|uniref:Uncharacterized protein n=1 Tax=Henosepilachna vigintioctopunctata TaxID=420089 RepID=A0AAW1U6I2_9CUCU